MSKIKYFLSPYEIMHPERLGKTISTSVGTTLWEHRLWNQNSRGMRDWIHNRVRNSAGPGGDENMKWFADFLPKVTKYRTEIEQQCHTRVDQKCKPTQTHVPSQECAPRSILLACHKYQLDNLVEQNQRIEYNFRYETRCETEYHTVKEPAYREECHEEVRCSVY